MIPEQGQGTIEASELLPQWLDDQLRRVVRDSQEYSIPYHLDTNSVSYRSQSVTQYQIYSFLNKYGNCYCEVKLQGTGRIDIIWEDPKSDRLIGIEVKSISEYKNTPARELREQVERYRNFTPIDSLSISVDQRGQAYNSDELYLFDGVWVALPREEPWQKDTNGEKIGDGWLTYDYLTGELSYAVEKANRNTISSSQYLDENVGEEAELVTALWDYYTNKEMVVTSEVGFRTSPHDRRRLDYTADSNRHKLSGKLRGDYRKADLVVGNKHALDEITDETEILGIEVKKSLSNKSRIINQLEDYIQSKLFTRVYLALPEKQAADAERILDEISHDVGLLPIRKDATSGASVRAPLVEADRISLESVPYRSYHLGNGDTHTEFKSE